MKVKFTVRQTDRTLLGYPAAKLELGKSYDVHEVWPDGDYGLIGHHGKFDSKHFEFQPEDFVAGQRVTYHPKFGDAEWGIAKQSFEGITWVVYKCGQNWDRYAEYTGVSTRDEDLVTGWVRFHSIPLDEDPRDGEERYHR